MEVAKITPDELMRGNYVTGVYDDGEAEQRILCTVTGYDPYEFGIYVEAEEDVERYDYFKPIPITEDWLIKLGFVKKSFFTTGIVLEVFYFQLNDMVVYLLKGYIEVEIIVREEQFNFSKKWYYVHQLQNLYRAITQQPLTIKK